MKSMNPTPILASLLLASIVLAPAWAQEDAAAEETAAATAEDAAAGERTGEAESQVPEPATQAPSLRQAYQREFAFLTGQKEDLERRLAELDSRMKTEQQQLERAISRLESEVVDTRSRADRLEDQVSESEVAVQTARDNAAQLAGIFTQADFMLGDDYSSEPGNERSPGPDDLRGLFEAALDVLQRQSSVYAESGSFFLEDGTQVDGEIVRVGDIAAYGISERGAGPLAPAGDRKFKIWNDENAETARAIAAGQAPETLPIFIFESLDNEVESKETQGLIGTINDGGVIGWIIVALGLLGFVLVVLRVIFLQRASASTEQVIESVSSSLKRGDVDAAQEKLKRKKGATARVVAAAVRNLDRDREHIEDIVSESILHESSHLNRFGSLILVIAAVSPLLGLLGTVTGMISTFDVITEFGTGDPKLLSGGISIALVTTQLGLAVAIPLLLVGNLLSGWAERIKDDMEKAALRVINHYTVATQGGEVEAR
ncbi:MAG: MotA/TolQ/ExbB proton channel family protein [Candidatus Wenzhouxiangella sp. M2_3B_020]